MNEWVVFWSVMAALSALVLWHEWSKDQHE